MVADSGKGNYQNQTMILRISANIAAIIVTINTLAI